MIMNVHFRGLFEICACPKDARHNHLVRGTARHIVRLFRFFDAWTLQLALRHLRTMAQAQITVKKQQGTK